MKDYNLTLRACLNRIYFRRKCKLEHCFCTEILSQIVIWYNEDDVTKKNRLSHVTSCLEIVTKKACLFEVQILDLHLEEGIAVVGAQNELGRSLALSCL
jgi:hypothetical protein